MSGFSAFRGEENYEAAKNNEAARLWISGVEALKRKVSGMSGFSA